MKQNTFDDIEGQEAQKHLQADLGNGFATYALVDGVWYSVNLGCGEIVADVRWKASRSECDQIVSILVRRARL